MPGKIIVCYCFFCLWVYTVTAQDAAFTQQYANRLYLNPAFAGLNHDWSLSATHRNQWPALNGSFITNQFAADYRMPGKKSSFGLVLQQDRAGVGGLQKLQASAIYAYQTNISDKWVFSAALQPSIAALRVNFDNLVFGDQLTDNGQTALSSAEVNNFNPESYVSFTAGGLVYSSQFWFGLTAANMNQPAYGFNEATELPLRFTVNTGYKFYLRSYEQQGQLFELSVSPAVTYTQQQNFRRTDVGIYTIYTPLTLGLMYKGLPVTGNTNQDQALAVVVGLKLEKIKIGFSHDAGLKGFSKQAGGANEISLVFEQLDLSNFSGSRNNGKLNSLIACPSF
ncbi:PorP/SprF family type IX secretion system membrane protein [Botryobacter ruber]|uniref:PorP/SprF family type IX secretion system membrane protein n=1 Tax=Botryobacter ruber TaxID=2171629 RepID=UPI000E0B0E03|nr:PorP/SprF family type IX secretion system membrane protein [Botryobacter ruber]